VTKLTSLLVLNGRPDIPHNSEKRRNRRRNHGRSDTPDNKLQEVEARQRKLETDLSLQKSKTDLHEANAERDRSHIHRLECIVRNLLKQLREHNVEVPELTLDLIESDAPGALKDYQRSQPVTTATVPPTPKSAAREPKRTIRALDATIDPAALAYSAQQPQRTLHYTQEQTRIDGDGGFKDLTWSYDQDGAGDIRDPAWFDDGGAQDTISSFHLTSID
jgi:hypothetical protein